MSSLCRKAAFVRCETPKRELGSRRTSGSANGFSRTRCAGEASGCSSRGPGSATDCTACRGTLFAPG